MKIAIEKEQNPNLFEILSSVSNLREAKKIYCELISGGCNIWKSKFLREMRIVTLLLLISITQTLALESYAQTKQLSLNFRNETILNLLNKIEEQSNFYFMYDATIVDVNQRKSISCENQPITTILDQLLKDTKIVYEISDRQIVLTSAQKAEVGQQKTVSGKVTDASGEPLPGVSVVLKSTTQGTITDTNGNYSLSNIPNETTLVFSFVGMKTQEISVAGKSTIDVVLAEEAVGIEEVVAIGYGTMSKKDLTGAVDQVKAEDFKNQPMTSFTDMLLGTVAGFYAVQQPNASGGNSLEIRGQKSLNASTDPMVVLDGAIFNGSLNDINPSDIETVDILKDASSAAVFGARAAAGVILVTTKKGKQGKPVINFSASVGIASAAHDFKAYDANGYLPFKVDVGKQTGSEPDFYYDDPNNLPEEVTLEQWRNASDNPQDDNTQEWLYRLGLYDVEVENYLAGKSIDWYDEVMQNGIRQNYDLSISGATERIKYYWSIGYQDNEGIYKGDKFATIRTRLNVDFKVTDWLSAGVNAHFSEQDNSTVPAAYQRWGLGFVSPYGNMYEDDGTLAWYPNSGTYGQNPFINYYGQDRLRKTDGLFASFYANIKLPFGFTYKISYQPRYSFFKDYNYWSTSTIIGAQDHSGGYGERIDRSTMDWILDHELHWKKEVGIHSLDLTLLYSAEESKRWSTTISNESFVPNENLGYHGLQFGTKPIITNDDQHVTGDAVMARLNYVLMGKYLLTASIRRDGYSAFGNKNPWAYFPAGAFAWKISEEDFFNVNWVSLLKARASIGVNGNREIGPYSALAQLAPNYSYNGSEVTVGVYNNTLANSNLVWERTESLNFAIDFGLFKNRISGTAEYYTATTNDLLMERALPPITGFSSIMSNLGELENKGFEFTLNTVNVAKSDFTWRSEIVFSLNRNKIKELFGDYDEEGNELPDYSNEWFPGQAIDRVWNYDITGIWQEDEAGEAAKYKQAPGDFKVIDVDGSYTYETLKDKQFIGYSKPRYRLGVRNDFTFLKNFTASVFIRADLGHIGSLPQGIFYTDQAQLLPYRNTYDVPYWTPENRINDYPRFDVNTTVYGGGIQLYKSKTFVRVQDVSLSYDVPTLVCNKMKLESLRIYGSARNLFTFTKWPWWDPETNDNPMPRITTLGISLSL